MSTHYLRRVTEVHVVQPYIVDVTFSDGMQRRIDLEPELWGEVFEPLRDPDAFAQVFVDEETIAWPNGADFAPEWLYEAGERLEDAA
jgi:hypothetical protein